MAALSFFDINKAPDLLRFLLQLSILLLPLAAAVAALARLKDPHPPKAAWLCVCAAAALFVIWLIPPGWGNVKEAAQLRSIAAVGLYIWVLFDWYRSAREDGGRKIDLLGILIVVAMLGMATTVAFM